MRVSERGILAPLALLLLAFSAIAQTQIFEARGPAPLSWQAELGFYLPFVLFALVSTYHFLEWARKHKRQAIILMLLIVGIASLIGAATANVPTPVLNSLTPQQQSSTGQGEKFLAEVQQQPASLQESLLKIRQALSETPYFSAGFDAIVLVASVIALAVVLLRMRRETQEGAVKPLIQRLTTEILAKTPREAVIQAYRLASISLQTGDLSIPDSDTPSDAFMRIKQFKPTVADAFWKLTLLFEEAKFSLHPISDSQAENATGYYMAISQVAAGAI